MTDLVKLLDRCVKCGHPGSAHLLPIESTRVADYFECVECGCKALSLPHPSKQLIPDRNTKGTW